MSRRSCFPHNGRIMWRHYVLSSALMQFCKNFTFVLRKKPFSSFTTLILQNVILTWPVIWFWLQESPVAFVPSSAGHVTKANISLLPLTSQDTETPSAAAPWPFMGFHKLPRNVTFIHRDNRKLRCWLIDTLRFKVQSRKQSEKVLIDQKWQAATILATQIWPNAVVLAITKQFCYFVWYNVYLWCWQRF